MKKLVICVAVLGMVWTSSAMADPVALVNAGFEQPAWYAQVNGFDGQYSNHPEVPGWEDDCDVFPSPPDKPRSGVKEATPHEGAYRGFLYFEDTYAENVVYQLTDQTIAAGEIYTLGVWGRNGNHDSVESLDEQLKLSFFYVDGTTHINLAFDVSFLPEDGLWHAYTAEFTVDADAPTSVGKTLGIKFANLDVGCVPGAEGWLHIDAVTLDVIPEPATMMLLGLGSLALLKRRRA